MAALEDAVISVDPIALKEEIGQLDKLVAQARLLEKREVESKLRKLREVLTQQGIFEDPKMKLLIFTEHKDTLDYLVEKMRDEWHLSVTQIHGGMKIGDRDTPGTRIYAEREFRESCQVMVATEAAGEGINLQFCWFMINYDIPWNPVRLEQRMGRIHRYGQEKDCLILNFVATNTREGRVLHKLFERLQNIEADLDPQQTGKIFNVLGDVFAANQLERMLREMYARNLSEDVIKSRIVEQVDGERFRKITNSTLEGLAKRSLNLSAIVGKSAEAKERRLVPEVVEDFFLLAGPMLGVHPKEIAKGKHCYRVGRVPKNLWSTGDLLEPRFGKLGKEYKQIVFDKTLPLGGPDGGLGDARPSSFRGRSRGSTPVCRVGHGTRLGILRCRANGTGAPRRVFGSDPRWPGEHSPPAAVCGGDVDGRFSRCAATDTLPRCGPGASRYGTWHRRWVAGWRCCGTVLDREGA